MAKNVSYARATDPYGGRLRDETAAERNERMRYDERVRDASTGSRFPTREVPDLSAVYASLERAAAQRVERARPGGEGAIDKVLRERGKRGSVPLLPRGKGGSGGRGQFASIGSASWGRRLAGMSTGEALFRAQRVRNPKRREQLTSMLRSAAEEGMEERKIGLEERRVGVSEQAERRLAAGQKQEIALQNQAEARLNKKQQRDEEVHDLDKRQRALTMTEQGQLFPLLKQRHELENAGLELSLRAGKREQDSIEALDTITGRAGADIMQFMQIGGDYARKYRGIMETVNHVAQASLKAKDPARGKTVADMAELHLEQLRGPEVQQGAMMLDRLMASGLMGDSRWGDVARAHIVNSPDPVLRDRLELAAFGIAMTRTNQDMGAATKLLRAMGVTEEKIMAFKGQQLKLDADRAATQGQQMKTVMDAMTTAESSPELAPDLQQAARQTLGQMGGGGAPVGGQQGPPPVPGFNAPAVPESNAPGADEARRMARRTKELKEEQERLRMGRNNPAPSPQETSAFRS